MKRDGGTFSKLNVREFIGCFERLAIACFHGDADKPSDHPKRTPNLHSAAAESDRARLMRDKG